MPPPQWPPPLTDCTFLPVDVHPRVLVAVPPPRRRGADRFHHVLAQHLRQRPAPHLQRGERHHVDAHVVVLEVRPRLPQLALRPVLGRVADRTISPVRLAPQVPCQSLVCRSRWSHLIFALCSDSNRSTCGGM